MSTRANIIIKDQYDTLIFYRHSDGYPEGAMPLLEKFMQWIKQDTIRNNVSQSAGWLTLLGSMEYLKENGDPFEPGKQSEYSHSGWKAGSIEPTTEIHGDIEYLYVLDLEKKKIETHKLGWDSKKGERIIPSEYAELS